MADTRVLTRMSKELEILKKSPPPGITCWPKEGRLNHLYVSLQGSESTPYEGGVFKLEIKIPNRYPFEPPHVQFLTKVYHPNIDTAGRICLDVLKSPPTGSWKPAHNLYTILTSIQQLLSSPNPDDGLMAEISSEYKYQRHIFDAKAKDWTSRHAKSTVVGPECTIDSNEPNPTVQIRSTGDTNSILSNSGLEVHTITVKDPVQLHIMHSNGLKNEETGGLTGGLKRKGVPIEESHNKRFCS